MNKNLNEISKTKPGRLSNKVIIHSSLEKLQKHPIFIMWM